MRTTHLLDLAREQIEQDGNIHLDTAAALMEEGLDVNTIERQMRKEIGL